MIQDIHFVEKSGDNSVVVGMTLITFVPTEDGSKIGKEVKINVEIEWGVSMTPYKNFPGVNNTNFYIKSVRKMEFIPVIHPTLENLFKRYFNEGTILKDLLMSLYSPYVTFIVSKDGNSSNVIKSMNKNVDIIKDIIKNNTINLKSNINVNDYLKPTPTPTGDQRDPKIKKLEQEASKYDTVGEFRKSNPKAYELHRIAVKNDLIQNRFAEQKKSIWEPEKLEQEASKYKTREEFFKNDRVAYQYYVRAAKKGLIQNRFKEEKLKNTIERLEQEASKYNSPKEFSNSDVSSYNLYRIAVRKGLIQDRFLDNRVNNKWTIDKLEQEVSKYDKQSDLYKNNIPAFNAYKRAVKKGLIQDRFLDDRVNNKWTVEKLEQEASKYNSPGEFFKSDLNAYQQYRTAVRKGLIQNRFKEEKLKNTIEKLEQEASKYNSPIEFRKSDLTAYQQYRTAVRKGLIQNRFAEEKKSIWGLENLEQEASKYKTREEFFKNNRYAYQLYVQAAKKGLIRNKFKEEKIKSNIERLEREASKYNSPIEFLNSNKSDYTLYRVAVNKGLIQDRFLDNRIKNKWTIEKLEQEASKYNTPKEFVSNNSPAYSAYKRAVRNGLIQNKFKKNK
jgi:chromosome segregation ATPase